MKLTIPSEINMKLKAFMPATTERACYLAVAPDDTKNDNHYKAVDILIHEQAVTSTHTRPTEKGNEEILEFFCQTVEPNEDALLLWWHTHPGMDLEPSSDDMDTIHGWVDNGRPIMAFISDFNKNTHNGMLFEKGELSKTVYFNDVDIIWEVYMPDKVTVNHALPANGKSAAKTKHQSTPMYKVYKDLHDDWDLNHFMYGSYGDNPTNDGDEKGDWIDNSCRCDSIIDQIDDSVIISGEVLKDILFQLDISNFKELKTIVEGLNWDALNNGDYEL